MMEVGLLVLASIDLIIVAACAAVVGALMVSRGGAR